MVAAQLLQPLVDVGADQMIIEQHQLKVGRRSQHFASQSPVRGDLRIEPHVHE
jgi:hypothetical protein